MPRTRTTRAPFAAVGERLTAVRKTLGGSLSQSEFAGRHGFNVSTYNTWETGLHRIGVDEAEILCATYGLTLDFIYLGRRDGLSEYALKVL